MLTHPNPDCPSPFSSVGIDPNATVAICRCIEYPKPRMEVFGSRMRKALVAFTIYLAGIISGAVILGNVFAVVLFITAGLIFAGSLVAAARTRAKDE